MRYSARSISAAAVNDRIEIEPGKLARPLEEWPTILSERALAETRRFK
jgi:hypothetical protein